MSNKLSVVSLPGLTPEQTKQFARLVAQEAHNQNKNHTCWFFVPSPSAYEAMAQFAGNDKCPKCGKGRVVCESHHGNINSWLKLKCHWGAEGCDFAMDVDDPMYDP